MESSTEGLPAAPGAIGRLAQRPNSPRERLYRALRYLVFGPPLRTDQERHERLGVLTGLAVFSADAISSVAYATEEILWVLAAVGPLATAYSLPVGLAIVALMFVVAASYNQTIRAYPHGGGSYVVSRENLGDTAGLVAGAALLVDYVLTVAVSTASGVAAITSAIPPLRGHEAGLGLAAVWFIAWVNLRGVRESGRTFAVPTYSFIGAMLLLIGAGVWKLAHGGWHPPVDPRAVFGLGSFGLGGGDGVGAGGLPLGAASGVTLFMLLRAFASGSTALSGIEAISNGVQAFAPPETENAVRTMNLERTIMYTLFGGVTVLAFGFRLLPRHEETLLSQIAHTVFGSGPLYYVVQATTMAILLLAANTAYQDFPRLAAFMARDGYLPRRFANRGDRLVHNLGIYVLAGAASVLLVVFRGSVHHLIPLYAVGVFLAFTLNQSGMVVHWLKERARAGSLPVRALALNGAGAVLSGAALVVTVVTKFALGAWVVTLVIPALVLYFNRVHAYYERFRAKVESLGGVSMAIDEARRVKVVLTIGGLSPVIDHSMRVARRISDDIVAVHVATDPEQASRIARKWDRQRHGGVELTVLESPYREIVPPLREFLERLQRENPGVVLDLLVPVIVTNDPFDAYLHNGVAWQVVRELTYSEGILITVIPFYVDMGP